MYVATVPNRNSRPAYLLRESYREGGKVKTRTVGNISHLPDEQIELIRRVLRGEKLVPSSESYRTERTVPTGHVKAVLGMMKKLQIAELLSSKPCRERSLVLGMIAERVLHPTSKLGTLRLWKTTTLAEDLGVEDATVDELYGAFAWLLRRKRRVEQTLAMRHLEVGGLALYDLSNSRYEGRCCEPWAMGKDKDGRRGSLLIAYGLLTAKDGCPVGIDVYPGNTEDSTTVGDQVLKMRAQFGLDRVVMVGDRGTLTNARIEELRAGEGMGWIAALRHASIRALIADGVLQMSLFDRQGLAEIVSPDYPGERLIACYNPLRAEEQRLEREELLQATEEGLSRIAREVARRTEHPMSAAQIGLKVGRILNQYRMGKHFDLEIGEGRLTYRRNEARIRAEASLDGIYVIRTSEPRERMSAEETVRAYKALSEVEAAFRCLKGLDLRVEPIFHRLNDRVRAHFLLCMLAYYVEWHLRRAWAPLLFQDEDLGTDRWTRDPVKTATPSKSAKRKKSRKKGEDGLELHSFETLLAALASQARVTHRLGDSAVTFATEPPPDPLQARAFALIGL